jgi:hypothetical protein
MIRQPRQMMVSDSILLQIFHNVLPTQKFVRIGRLAVTIDEHAHPEFQLPKRAGPYILHDPMGLTLRLPYSAGLKLGRALWSRPASEVVPSLATST